MAYSGNEPYIFISYSHRDITEATEIITQLQSAGYRVWFDEGIDPGTEWDEFIAEHIKSCAYFVSLVSQNYLASSNCKDELNYARDLDKPRLLIFLQDVQLADGMKMRLNRLQNIHKYTYQNPADFYAKLFTASGIDVCLERKTADPSQPCVAPQQPSAAVPPQGYTAPVQPYSAPQQSYTPRQPYQKQPSTQPQQKYTAPRQPYATPQRPDESAYAFQNVPQHPVSTPAELAPKKNNKMLIIIIAIVAAIAIAIVVGGICLKIFVFDKKDNNTSSVATSDINDNEDYDNTNDAENEENNSSDIDNQGNTDEPENNSTNINSDFLNIKREVKKIAEIENYDEASSGGIIYKEKGLYGIMNYSGEKVTKAIYYDCVPKYNFFAVSTGEISRSITDVSTFNFTGLVDGEGNTIIPAEYFKIIAINDRYFEAIEVTDTTDSEEDSIAYIRSDPYALSLPGAKDGDTLLKGSWCIIDTTTGEKVPGASGTRETSISINGIVISFDNDEGERVSILTDGSDVDPEAVYFSNGYYAKDDTVYDSFGNIAFNYDRKNISIQRGENGYLIANVFDGGSKYCLYDFKGNKVSAYFDESIYSVVGNLIRTHSGKVCNFEGTQVIDALVSEIHCDGYVGKLYLAYDKKDSSKKILFLEDGTVIWTGSSDDGYTCYLIMGGIVLSNRDSNGDCNTYSFKDNSFSLKGSSDPYFTVSVSYGNFEYGRDLIDAISGETLLESYSIYSLNEFDGHYYILARKNTGGTDIYELTIKE